MGTSMANMSDNLKKARDLARELPSSEAIKLHKRQCEQLRIKLTETLDHVENEEIRSCAHPERYSEVFHELCLVARRLKIFVDNCCYNEDDRDEFVLAAIRVSAHRERFVKYHVELDWCIFLVDCIKNANSQSVCFEMLEQHPFDWGEAVDSVIEVTASIVEEDFNEFKELLRQAVNEQGDHQRICATLLRRFELETDTAYDRHQVLPDHHHVDQLGVPPFESAGERIGARGGYGEVLKLNWKGMEFAVKVPRSDTMSKPWDTEAAILEKCCHPNIVNLILFYSRKQSGEQYLMMERLSMDLQSYVENRKSEKGSSAKFTHLEAVDMILQVCEGMRYLSDEQGVSHRDLKPQNILIRKDPHEEDLVLEVQVADFGLAKLRTLLDEMTSENTPNFGTSVYRAPEMSVPSGQGQGKIHEKSFKADMYSFAVTCSYILTGEMPYRRPYRLKQTEPAVEEAIESSGWCCVPKKERKRKSPGESPTLIDFIKSGGRPTLPEDCPHELSSLLKECWDSNPSERPASFTEICDKLRKLKAKLLVTCDVGEGDEQDERTQENDRKTFNPRGDIRPLRILVLGDSDAVKAICSSIFGASRRITNDAIIKCRSASPPLWLYHDTTRSVKDLTDFVKRSNKLWQQKEVKAAWKEFLYDPPRDQTTSLFPNSNSRLHMVWFVCTSVRKLPDDYLWEKLTKELYGLPVQILVTGEYENILQYSRRYLSKNQKPEELFMKVDMQADIATVKFELWQTCWKVKTQAEIENAAKIIREIRKELGPDGSEIRVQVGFTSKTKKFLVRQSKMFIIDFLCTYWDIPRSLIETQIHRIKTQQAAAPAGEIIQRGEFILFCLQYAASILYSEREHLHALGTPAESSSQIMESRELAPACSFKSYFRNLDLAACDKMKFEDIQTFLQAVFEGRALSFGE